MTSPLVVALGGFWRPAVLEAARRLLAGHPDLRVIECGRGQNPAETLRRAAADGEDVLALLPETFEPDRIRLDWRAQPSAAALHLITVAPADLVMTGLADETALHQAGLHEDTDDTRDIGDVVCRQIEQADTVLLAGEADGDAWETDQVRVLLRRIAPWAQHHDLLDARLPARPGHTEPVTPTTRGLRGRDVGIHDPAGAHGVVACLFRARRPLHPERLHEALGEIIDQVVRSRGHFWLASRPDLVMTWESAGDLTIGPASVWLDSLPVTGWSDVHPERHLAASLDWDPYYGDRHHHLAFVGVDLDPVRLHRTLDRCLLTDAELAGGEESWRQFPDPFAAAYPAPRLEPDPAADDVSALLTGEADR